MQGQGASVSEQDSRAIATLVREAIAKRRITRQLLADQARISLSTLEKALSGHRPFTLATIIRLEDALGLSLRGGAPEGEGGSPVSADHAPDDVGAYSRASVSWIEGDYLTLRPSFSDLAAIFAYCTRISWDSAASCLCFQEKDRLDASFSQEGTVSVPNRSGHVYLTTNAHGQHRLVIASRPAINGEMYGILTTLRAAGGPQLTPVATPIAFVPLLPQDGAAFGRIDAGHGCYDAYRAYLRRTVEASFALLLDPP